MKTRNIIIYHKDYNQVCNFLQITFLIPLITFQFRYSYPSKDMAEVNEDDFRLDFSTRIRYTRDYFGYIFAICILGFGIRVDRQWTY